MFVAAAPAIPCPSPAHPLPSHVAPCDPGRVGHPSPGHDRHDPLEGVLEVLWQVFHSCYASITKGEVVGVYQHVNQYYENIKVNKSYT